MNKQKIVYIHGFGGSPFTQTVGFLNLYYPDYEWCALEVDHHAGASIKKINDFAKENDVKAMIGTSLGGFYVLCSDFRSEACNKPRYRAYEVVEKECRHSAISCPQKRWRHLVQVHDAGFV